MTVSTAWIEADRPVSLKENEVDVWRVPIGRRDALSGMHWLSPQEKQKASAFFFERDRIRYLESHITLRLLLGWYLEIPPDRVHFSTNPYGKPFIQEPEGYALSFNLSHAGDLALIAVAWNLQIGIDIEKYHDERVDPLIAQRYFAPGEAQRLFALPEEQRKAGFFNCWTRKEAYVKGRGLGLSLPLDSFEVTLEPGLEEVVLASSDHPEEASFWQIRPIDPGEGYTAALAVRAWDWKLNCFQLRKIL